MVIAIAPTTATNPTACLATEFTVIPLEDFRPVLRMSIAIRLSVRRRVKHGFGFKHLTTCVFLRLRRKMGSFGEICFWAEKETGHIQPGEQFVDALLRGLIMA